MKSAEKKTAKSSSDKSSSGKKLIQARLPFKVIATSSPASAAAIATSAAQSSRDEAPKKRKLSYTNDTNAENAKKIACTVGAKENQETVSVVLLSDDDEQVENGAAGTAAELPGENDDLNPFVKLTSIDTMVTALKNNQTGRVDLSPKTPKDRRRSLGKVNGDSTPSDKFLIKMEWSSNKKKRKLLQKEKKESADTDSDIEIVEANPEKKLKIDEEVVADKKNESANTANVELQSETKVKVDMTESKAELDSAEKTENQKSVEIVNEDSNSSSVKSSRHDDEVISVECDSAKSEHEDNKDDTPEDVVKISALDSEEGETKKEMPVSDTPKNKRSSKKADKSPSKSDVESKPASPSNDAIELNDSSNQSYLSEKDKTVDLDESKSKILDSSLTLTPRQLKKKQESDKKQKAKEEREKKLNEEKMMRQKEKEDKEKQRKKEREEKEDQKRKEREEKEEQRRKEKEEKEKKRLAEIEAKNEERRKKDEAKEEERKKKDEERRKKELEKEEADNKKKKAAEAFTKFFVPKKNTTKSAEDRLSIESDVQEIHTNFMPFQVKGDMKLAPLFRRILNKQSKTELERILEKNDAADRDRLYLNCLKSGQLTVGKDTRTLLRDDDGGDVIIIEDELKGAGQSIDDEKEPAQKFRAKLFLFRENSRPPYYGTWRKKSRIVGPRRPFATDKALLDYEGDSDEEWEEEEPGESLHGSDDEKESEDEYEVDNEFFVPHGHLSDEEMQNEDELDDDNTPETQKAKLKILQQEFAQEMKKKTEKIKPRLIGTVWADENGNQPSTCSNVIWQSLCKRAMWYNDPIVLTEPEPSAADVLSSTQKDKQIRSKLTDDLVKDLIRLVHFNRHRKEFMIREFKAYLAEKYKADLTIPNYTKISIQKKIEKLAKWDMFKDEVLKKNKLCWIVSAEMLKRYEMEDIGITNKWKYTLQPKSHSLDVVEEKPINIETESNESNCKTKTPAVITKFTKVLSELEKAKQFDSLSQPVAVPAVVTQPKKLPFESSKDKSKIGTTDPVIVLNPAAIVKKRVPLLISVPRGQKIAEKAKNDLISKFLKTDKTKDSKETSTITKPNEPDKVQAMDVDQVMVVD